MKDAENSGAGMTAHAAAVKDMVSRGADAAGAKPATGDVMRQAYKQLSEAEQLAMKTIKDRAAELHALITSLGASRETSIAKTKLEEAVMWAVKHITA